MNQLDRILEVTGAPPKAGSYVHARHPENEDTAVRSLRHCVHWKLSDIKTAGKLTDCLISPACCFTLAG